MKNPFRATVTDHRGKVCPMVPLELFVSLGGPSDRVRRLREANKGPFKTESLLMQVSLFVLLLAICFASVFAMVWLRTALTLKLWQFVLSAAIAGILMGVGLIFVARLFASKRVVQVYTNAGCCASCGYDLVSVAEDSIVADGCRVCPECNAAWRIVSN